uniref:Adenylate cyclase protein n=1 Tax=Pseudomonas sp. K-62 TaxID=76885 RepID=I2FG57_9PSED|nr:adenylate/guanylate cyclase domain-containing protein [Pseudomonas sp. K-62]BAM13992.1 adenylate cyclase protein [Pseudomonas sp. K-62]
MIVETDLESMALALAATAAQARSLREFIAGAGTLWAATPLRVERIFMSLRMLHPAFRARTYLWENDAREVRVIEWPHGLANRPGYYHSPDHHVHRTRAELRVPELSETSHHACDLYTTLARQGFVDYLIVPLIFSDGTVNTCSIATRTPTGFPASGLGAFRSLVNTLTLIAERFTALEMVDSTLQTYLGRSASREVLRGKVRAGQGELVRAAILFADLVDFTSLTAQLGPTATVRLLNDYFDVLVGPIEQHGGHVLKFIGDALLAFFPDLPDSQSPTPLEALREIQLRISELNRVRAAAGEVPVWHALCLHYGEVLYGNIGASERLDFTIIGEAVNIAARGVELAKQLRIDHLVTKAFADRFQGSYATVGVHQLRGIPRPIAFLQFQRQPHPGTTSRPSEPAKADAR